MIAVARHLRATGISEGKALDWIKVLQTIFKAKKFYTAYATVEKVNKYAQKVQKQDPGKMDWDELRFIQNDDLFKARKELEEIEQALSAGLSGKAGWPESGAMKAYMDAIKAVEKKGKDSKEAQDAVAAYRKALYMYDRELTGMVKELREGKAEAQERRKVAEGLVTYTMACRDAFMACAKIPTFTGTAQNALFLSMSEDCGKMAGIAGRIAKMMDDVAYRTAEVIVEGEALIEQNKAWMDWAIKDALKKDDTLKKNQKAETPR